MKEWARGGQFANDLLLWVVMKSDRMYIEGVLDAKLSYRIAMEDKLRQHARTLLSLVGESLYYTSTTYPQPHTLSCLGRDNGVHLKWLQHMHRIAAFNHRAIPLSKGLLLLPDTITNPSLCTIASERVWAYIGPITAHPPTNTLIAWMNTNCTCSDLITPRGLQSNVLLSNLQLELAAGLWDVPNDAIVADYFDYTLFVGGSYTLDIESQMGLIANSFDLEQIRSQLNHF